MVSETVKVIYSVLMIFLVIIVFLFLPIKKDWRFISMVFVGSFFYILFDRIMAWYLTGSWLGLPSDLEKSKYDDKNSKINQIDKNE